MKVRAVTLNVWNTEGEERRLDLINQELRRLNPDLIALQEVVQTPKTSCVERLLKGLDLQATHQVDVQPKVPPFADRYGGSAVATRWPHRFVECLDLRLPEADDVPWATLAVSVDVPGEGDLLFIGASAAWRLSAEAARERQAVAITELDARQRGPLPTIIAGDFNAAPDAASIRYLTGLQALEGRSVHYHDAWAVAGDGAGLTWTTENPNAAGAIGQIVGQPRHGRRIDYIFVGGWDAHPKARATVRNTKLVFDEPVDGVWLSDHYGLCADIEFSVA
jgi:endonuclease/exonuclease/phosphatase family metal-dependent hydrolase